jgi:hypothetical protein
MQFKELDKLKTPRSNSYGTSAYVYKYVYYDGTEQISIHIKNGFGASEESSNEVISEHELTSWCENFKGIEREKPKLNLKVITPEPLKPKVKMEENKTELNYQLAQNILLETMQELKNGSINSEKAKAIASVGQVLINSVKVEAEILKQTRSNQKPNLL